MFEGCRPVVAERRRWFGTDVNRSKPSLTVNEIARIAADTSPRRVCMSRTVLGCTRCGAAVWMPLRSDLAVHQSAQLMHNYISCYGRFNSGPSFISVLASH